MNRKNRILIIILLLIAGTILVLEGKNETKTENNPAAQNTARVKESVVELNKTGFSPNKMTIKKETAVRWKNISGEDQTVNSNDHPTNKLHPELNFGIFKNGSSFVYTFQIPGTYKYHNYFHPEQQGTIIVEK